MTLSPEASAEGHGSTFVARDAEPWLRVEARALIAAAGRFVAIRYHAGFWDVPARPIFRFITAEGAVVERIGTAPVAGGGVWIGRVPRSTCAVHVSPASRPGPFSFAIDGIETRWWLALLVLGVHRAPRSTRSAILTRLIGWKPESDINLAWAIGAIPVADYPAWSARRARAVDLAGLDRPRADWTRAEPMTVVVDARGSGDSAATLRSLSAQVFPQWRAVVVGRPGAGADDPRIAHVAAWDAIGDMSDWVCAVAAGDLLPPHALACVAEAVARHPAGRVVYGDEEVVGAGGAPAPVFKPGWSPILQSQRPYLGRAVFVRAPSWTDAERIAFFENGHLPPHWLDTLPSADVLACRRVLLRGQRETPPPIVTRAAPPVDTGSAAIIIPTRDQPARLRQAIASIRSHRGARAPRILVVDNGSVTPEAIAHFAELRDSADCQVLAHPGAFNFSAMCNEAAALAGTDVLVFLNDDTRVVAPEWLDRLVGWARQPGIGAVGARLTYPDGRLQHTGVLLGMGESAGHFGAFADPRAPGWMGRHQAVHEVSAVTGACLAVERRKFEAVGGFDAVDLPIELSDIDLCLKLAGRGWVTLVDPGVHLDHEESASRGGATFRRLDVYESQRQVFRDRWRHVIRDDPYFHPALSLYAWTPTLG